MAVPIVKCIYCEASVSREDCEPVSSGRRYVCKTCSEDYYASQTIKEAEKEINQTQADAYKELISYICELFKIKAPTMLMVQQIKSFKEKYDFTYQGMKATLYYFFELQKHSTEDSLGVGIIPFIYADTKAFYKGQQAMSIQLENYDLEKIRGNSNIITVKRQNDNDFKNTTFIPLEDISEEEENDE